MSSGDFGPFAEVANCHAVLKCYLLLSLLIVVTGHVARVERAGLVEEARFVGLASFHFCVYEDDVG